MKNLKLHFIFNSILLYTFSSFVICVILLIFTNNLYAEQNLKKALDLWENNSFLNETNQEKNRVNNNPPKDKIENSKDVSKSLGKIIQNNLEVSFFDTLGLYDDSNNGLEPSIWKYSDLKQIQFLLDLITEYMSSATLTNLLHTSLLTISSPPKNIDYNESSFFDLKVQYLYNTGNNADLKLLINSIDENELSDDLLKKIINLELMFGNHKSACRTGEKIDDQTSNLFQVS